MLSCSPQYNISLATMTSWGIGGKCDIYYKITTIQQISEFLIGLSLDVPVYWLGLGSNLLIRDGGFPGAILHVLGGLANISVVADKLTSLVVRVEAGVTCAKLAKFAIKQNLVGAEFFAGIPGTFGGALNMNAGAFGGDTWGLVTRLEVIDRQGCVNMRMPHEYEVSYRSVKKKNCDDNNQEWFTAAWLEIKRGDGRVALHKMKKLLHTRQATQPIGKRSCGSVFKNPPGNHAAALIEKAGLKGYAIGDAEVSTKHANFIINKGMATALQVESLVDYIKQEIFGKFAITLEPEFKVVGEQLL